MYTRVQNVNVCAELATISIRVVSSLVLLRHIKPHKHPISLLAPQYAMVELNVRTLLQNH
jgi:hypothetical protein